MSGTTIRSFGDWELVLFDLGTGEKGYVHKTLGHICEDPPDEVLKIIEAENRRRRRRVYDVTPFKFAAFPNEGVVEVGGESQLSPCTCCEGSGMVSSYGVCPLCEGSGAQDSTLGTGPSRYGTQLRPMQKFDILGTTDGSAFVIRNFLSASECKDVIEQAEGFGLESCGYSNRIRITDRVSVMGEDLAAMLFSRVQHYLADIDTHNQPKSGHRAPGIRRDARSGIWKPVGLNPCFRVCKYKPGGFFLPHHDGGFEEDDQTWSFKTFMMYLNDDFTGGTTNFFEESQRHYESPDPAKVRYVFKPELGSCLVFNQSITHDGGELESGVKYILRTEVMYELQPKEDSTDSEDDPDFS